MAFQTYITHTITSAGASIAIDIQNPIDTVILAPSSAPLTMLGNITVTFSGTPTDGQLITVGFGYFDLNGNSMTINGFSVTPLQASLANGILQFGYIDGTWRKTYTTSLALSQFLDGSALVDETVTLDKLENLASGKIIVGDGTNRPAAVTPTGDVTITNVGVTAIASGVIVNANINASAAIARTKLANGSASQVLINDGSGVMTSEAQLAAIRGGNGQNFKIGRAHV